MLLCRKTIEIQIFSFASFASIPQVPTVLASPGRRVANAFGGFAIDTTADLATSPRAISPEIVWPPGESATSPEAISPRACCTCLRTVLIQSIRRTLWPVTDATKFWFRRITEEGVTASNFRRNAGVALCP